MTCCSFTYLAFIARVQSIFLFIKLLKFYGGIRLKDNTNMLNKVCMPLHMCIDRYQCWLSVNESLNERWCSALGAHWIIVCTIYLLTPSGQNQKRITTSRIWEFAIRPWMINFILLHRTQLKCATFISSTQLRWIYCSRNAGPDLSSLIILDHDYK